MTITVYNNIFLYFAEFARAMAWLARHYFSYLIDHFDFFRVSVSVIYVTRTIGQKFTALAQGKPRVYTGL